MMKKLFIETYGCQMNVADSEVVASVMQMAGYETCESLEEADAVFLNTCSVRDNAEQKIYHRLEALGAIKRKRPLVIGVLGCMAERVQQDLLENHGADLVAGPDAYMTLPDLVAQAELGHKAMNIELSTSETYKDVVPQRIGLGHKIGGFVSIMRGCNNFCHYCIVPYTRGRERSRDVESILCEVRDLRDRGFKEVTLLGQNVNSYKSEVVKESGKLLRKLFRLRRAMNIILRLKKKLKCFTLLLRNSVWLKKRPLLRLRWMRRLISMKLHLKMPCWQGLIVQYLVVWRLCSKAGVCLWRLRSVRIV